MYYNTHKHPLMEYKRNSSINDIREIVVEYDNILTNHKNYR